MDKTELVDIKALAKVLDVSVSTIRKRTSNGKLPNPHSRNGDALYWSRADLRLKGIQV